MTPFSIEQRVTFQHCDPAGIAFYPRLFEFINLTVETWFEDRLGLSFARLHLDEEAAVPTVHIETDFRRPCRLGETLRLELRVLETGRSSVRLQVAAHGADGEKFTAEATLVHVRGDPPAAAPWPEAVRAAMERAEANAPLQTTGDDA